MPKGDGEDYLEPEHATELRELRAGGLSRPPGCQKPSKRRPPPPYVFDKRDSEITAGDWVRIEDDVYKVRAVDVSAKKWWGARCGPGRRHRGQAQGQVDRGHAEGSLGPRPQVSPPTRRQKMWRRRDGRARAPTILRLN